MSGYKGASRGFPIAWEEEVEAKFPLPAEIPFRQDEIENYLERNHYHLLLAEPPLLFSFAGVVEEKIVGERRFWGVQCRDDWERVWFVLIGSGISPLRPDRFMRRWMIGVSVNGSLSLDQMLEAEIEDQRAHDRRSAQCE